MPLDPTIIGRTYPPGPPSEVTDDGVRSFVSSVGGAFRGTVPATFPIVAAFGAMMGFLDAEQVDLSRVIHGEQRFVYERPLRVGDVVTARLTVTTLRRIGGNDIVGTSTSLVDTAGGLVCTGAATLVHRDGTTGAAP